MIITPETYRCQICQRVSTDRKKIEACEAQGILQPLFTVGETIYCKFSHYFGLV